MMSGYVLIGALAVAVVALLVALQALANSRRCHVGLERRLANLDADVRRLMSETKDEREAREQKEAERRRQAEEERKRRTLEEQSSGVEIPPEDQDCRCHSPGDSSCTWK